jgi:hypothetical protein
VTCRGYTHIRQGETSWIHSQKVEVVGVGGLPPTTIW